MILSLCRISQLIYSGFDYCSTAQAKQSAVQVLPTASQSTIHS